MTEADETITVDNSDGSLRLDRWFKRHYPGLGHGQLEKLLRATIAWHRPAYSGDQRINVGFLARDTGGLRKFKKLAGKLLRLLR